MTLDRVLDTVPGGGASVCSLSEGNGDFMCADRSILLRQKVENVTCELDRAYHEPGDAMDKLYHVVSNSTSNSSGICLIKYSVYLFYMVVRLFLLKAV